MPRARLAIFSSLALAATALQAAPGAAEPLTGHWSVAGEYLGARVYLALELKQEGEKLTGR